MRHVVTQLVDSDEVWTPGSFTKNFSWGPRSSGLAELHSAIRIGFDERLEDVPRSVFRQRVERTGRPVYIPINFFLFNRIEQGDDLICADELVFQALSWQHGPAFDRVALFAFLFSYAGRWKSARREQRRPALWAKAYILERLSRQLHWDHQRISADDIQEFVQSDHRYKAQTSRKLATNLNYLLRIGRIGDFAAKRVGRWWVDCLFLALDRLVEDARIDGREPSAPSYPNMLERSGFLELTGGQTLEKSLAVNHLVRLYAALGGRRRLSESDVEQRTLQLLPEEVPLLPNDPRPRGAIHVTNPVILKSIPPTCCSLARLAGFDIISPDEMDELRVDDFIRQRTGAALAVLRERGIAPRMSVDELLRITRDE